MTKRPTHATTAPPASEIIAAQFTGTVYVAGPPTRRQLSYLVRLASSTGMTFVRPTTTADASRQITLLKAEAARQAKERRRRRT